MVKIYLHNVNYNYKLKLWHTCVFDFTIPSGSSTRVLFTPKYVEFDVLFDTVVQNNVILELICLNNTIMVLIKL